MNIGWLAGSKRGADAVGARHRFTPVAACRQMDLLAGRQGAQVPCRLENHAVLISQEQHGMGIREEIRGRGEKAIGGRWQLSMTPTQSIHSVAVYRERREACRRTHAGLQTTLPGCNQSRRNRYG